KVKSAKTDPETKLIALEAIATDIESFKSAGTLPKSDDLIPPTLKFLGKIQPIVTKIEEYRDDQMRDALKKLDPTDLQRWKDLDGKLNSMIPGRDQFIVGSKWGGTRQDPKHAFHWVVTVEKMQGGRFSG